MSHTIHPYTEYVNGDSIVWPFQLKENGALKDLTNATVEYYVLRGEQDADADAVADHTDSGVTVAVEPSSPTRADAPSDVTGYIEVIIDAGVVDYPSTTLWQRLRVTTGDGGRRTFGGEWRVNQV